MGLWHRSDDTGGGGFYWDTRCPSDPRFNLSGYAHGMFGAAAAIDGAILAKAKELGIEPPDDIEYGGCKR